MKKKRKDSFESGALYLNSYRAGSYVDLNGYLDNKKDKLANYLKGKEHIVIEAFPNPRKKSERDPDFILYVVYNENPIDKFEDISKLKFLL